MTATEREALAQTICDNRKAERAHLYEPAGVTVLEWESMRRQQHETERRLERTLRQLATTHQELQTAQAALEHLRRGADNL